MSLAERNIERNERRKYAEVINNLKKKEKQNREILEQISKKLKVSEKKSTEETKISIELKKRHDIMQKKLEISVKEKGETTKQLKQLYVIFTKQRKALELSIKKNKKFETDAEISDRNLQESNRIASSLQMKID